MGERHLGLLAEQAAQHGGTLVFEGERFESLEQWERSLALAGGLAAAGVEPGDRVVVLMSNCPELPRTYQALWRIGAVVTPVIFLVTAPELAHVLRDSGARAVITTSEFAHKVAETGLPVPTYVVGEASFAELETGAPAALVDRDDHDLAALLYTGGTTGRSKGVMIGHGNLWAAGKALRDKAEAADTAYPRTISALPLTHAFGMLILVFGMFSPEPRHSVLMRWFDARSFVELVEEHEIQVAGCVPSMLQLMLALPLEDYDLSSLRTITSGGAPMPQAIGEEWERRVPSCVVIEGYGLTETSALVSSSARDERRWGSVGKPVPSIEVRITAPDGSALPTGEDGEICVRSPTVTPGYWNAPEQTAEAIRDGWLHTGDVGHLDADGFLYVVDRLKDLIIRGGFNVYPRDVEDVLLTHPEVTGAAVVGRPDPTYGEEVVAFVSLADGAAASEDDLREWVRARVSGAKYPREVHLIDAIPLTSVGKTDRKALRLRLTA